MTDVPKRAGRGEGTGRPRGEGCVKNETGWSDGAISQEHLEAPEVTGGGGAFSPRTPGAGRSLAHALVLNFWPPQL